MVTPTKARVHDVGELLRLLPYSLGFHPGRCAMCVVVERGRLELVQRLPVPDGGWIRLPRDVLDACARTLHGPPGRTALLVGWEQTHDESVGGLAVLARLCALAGVGVDDVVLVRGERWWRLSGIGPSGPGRPLPPAANVAAIAEFVGLGRAPLPNRSDLDELFEAGGDPRRAGVAAAVAAARRRYAGDPRASGAEGLRAWACLARGMGDDRRPRDVPPGGDDPAVIGAALACLDDADALDALFPWLVPALASTADSVRRKAKGRRACTPGSAAGLPATPDRQLLLRDLGRVAPPGARAPILTLCGMAAWAGGDGPLAETATRLALADDDTYAPARWMYAAIRGGVRFETPPAASHAPCPRHDCADGPGT